MQNSRTFLITCAAVFCVALLPLCAADSDADQKLREALEKKLNELQTQPPAPIPQPKKTTAPPAAAAPAAVPAAQPAPAPVIIAPPPTDSETIAKAREALRQKMNELQTQPGQAVPQPVVTAPPPVKTIPAVAVPAPAPRPTPPAQWTPPPAAQPLPPVAKPARVPAPAPAPTVQAAPKPISLRRRRWTRKPLPRPVRRCGKR